MAARAARALPSISSLSGQAGVVSSMVNATAPPSIAMRNEPAKGAVSAGPPVVPVTTS